MIRAGVGFSLSPDSFAAAREASVQAMDQSGAGKADWVLVFCTFPHRANYEEVIKIVGKITRTSNLCGCSAVGVLSSRGEVEASPGITVLAVTSDEISARSFMVHQMEEAGRKAGEEIGSLFKPSSNGANLLAIMPDPFHVHPELLFLGVKSKTGPLDIVGASASEDPRINDTFGFHKNTVASEAVPGVFLQGDFSYTVGITQGCKLIGTPAVVTRAEKNIIAELDGKPALEVLKQHVPASMINDPAELMRLLFVAFPPEPGHHSINGGEYLVRNLMGYDKSTGAIGVAQHVCEGQTVSFTMRNPQMAREDLKEMLARVSSARDPEKPYRFGLYFNCCARGRSLYGHDGIDTAYINNALDEIPITGFFGNSEFGPMSGGNRLFTYTGVLVLFSES